MKLLALTVTCLAAAAWAILLIWQSLMVCEAWRYDDLMTEDVPVILFALAGLTITVVLAWRWLGRSASAVLILACASLGVALFLLAIVSATGGAQIGFDVTSCVSPAPAHGSGRPL